MSEYHKIQTVFLRDPETNYKTLLGGQWARPEFGYLANCEWTWTEKVDGTNIRVLWDGTEREFRGKTDRACIPARLIKQLESSFPPAVLKPAFDYPGRVCLYGEGYGAGIQKGGGNYIADGVDFILFDVTVDGMFLERRNVEDVAHKLGIKVVPIVGKGPIPAALTTVQLGFTSQVAEGRRDPEGLVLRPSVELTNRHGQRVITKIKREDFGQTQTARLPREE